MCFSSGNSKFLVSLKRRMYTQTYAVWENRVDFVAVGAAVHKILHAWLYFAVLGWEEIRKELCLCNVPLTVSVLCQWLWEFCIHDCFSFAKLHSEYCTLKSTVFYIQHSPPQNSVSLLKYFVWKSTSFIPSLTFRAGSQPLPLPKPYRNAFRLWRSVVILITLLHNRRLESKW